MLMTVLKGELATKQSIAYRFQLTKDELKEIARSKNLTAQIWATNKGGQTLSSHLLSLNKEYILMTILKCDFDIIV